MTAGRSRTMWTPGKILVSAPWHPNGYRSVDGYVYRDLGLYMALNGSPKGRRPPRWILLHLGSGHSVCWIKGHVKDAFPIATEIAECGDWSFDGLEGWRNVDRELPEKFNAIQRKYPELVDRGAGNQSEESARAIAIARAS